MAGPLRLTAPAKLNLMLRVLSRQGTGYHELQTLFELLDWGDEMQFRVEATAPFVDQPVRPEEPPVQIEGEFAGVPTRQNLIWKAASRLWPFALWPVPVRIEVNKNIPTGGGLGGGSSNAATALKVLNEYWQCGQSEQDLMAHGLALGADVPVFLSARPALAGGVGERLTHVELPVRHFVLVFPDEGLSTAAVFADPDLPRDSQPLTMAQALEPARWSNDCLGPALKRCSPLAVSWQKVEAIRQQPPFSTKTGVFGPHLSGTGSTFFVAFDEEEMAQDFMRALRRCQQESGHREHAIPARFHLARSWRPGAGEKS